MSALRLRERGARPAHTTARTTARAAAWPLAALALAAPAGAQGGLVAYDTGALLAGDAAPWDQLGGAVAVSGDTAVAGARWDDSVGEDAGAAYVFVHDGTSWSQQAQLFAGDAAPHDQFGSAVAIDGDRIVVGSPFDDDAGERSGSAYVFVRAGGVWTEEAKLVALDAAAGDELGGAVAIDGERAAAGASGDDDAGAYTGAAYVFLRSGASWAQETKLLANPAVVLSYFGTSVALDAERLVVGATGYAEGAFVFDRAGGVWTFVERLIDPAGAAADGYGRALAVRGDRVAVGAPGDDDNGPDSGSVFVFAWDGMAWSLEAQLVAGESFGALGSAVALDADRLVAGAPRDHLGGATPAGAAYVFERVGAAWLQGAQLAAAAPTFLADFGAGVALDAGRVVVGAPLDDAQGTNAGAAATFAVVPAPRAFCPGDGSGTACPCGNDAPSGSAGGCVNSLGVGSALVSHGIPSVGGDALELAAANLLPQQPALLFVGANAVNGGAGVTFGDGLRCAGGGVLRLGVELPDAQGDAGWGPGLSAPGGFAPGDVRRFQCWYRDPSGGPCGTGFNLSNGVEVVFVP